MKTKNLNDLKKSNIVELTKEQQRKIIGGNASTYEEDYVYGISLNFEQNATTKPLGTSIGNTSQTAGGYM